jgi:hypothetical protein
MARKLKSLDKKTTKKKTTKKKTTKKKLSKKAAKKVPVRQEEPDYETISGEHDEFLYALDRLNEFMRKETVQPIISSLRALIADYNMALDAFKHVFREQAVGRGPKKQVMGEFKLSRVISKTFDINTLTEAIPLNELEDYGAVETKISYKFNEEKLLDLVGSAQLPEEVYRVAMQLVEKTPRVSTPYKVKAL